MNRLARLVACAGASAFAVITGGVGSSATTAAGASTQAAFRSETASVALYATVRGPEGRLVADLPREAFEVLDDGVRVPITSFSNAEQPITGVVMADMSGSVGLRELPRVRQSLRYFVHTLRPDDRLRIGTFGSEVALSYELTNDRVVLERVIAEELWPGGGSPLWRAVDAAMRSLESEPGRKVIVVLTDGVNYTPGGTEGLPRLPDGVAGLRRRLAADSSFLVYAIGLGNPLRRQRLGDDIVRLVRESGGGHVDLEPVGDLERIPVEGREHTGRRYVIGAEPLQDLDPAAHLGQVLEGVGEELRRQYVIGFTPRYRDGRSHRIRLEVSLPGATVRTRESYIAPAPAGGQAPEAGGT